MNHGSFEEAALTYRIALHSMKMVDGGDIKENFDSLDMSVRKSTLKLDTKVSNETSYPRTQVFDIAFNELQTINFNTLPDFTNPGLFSIRIDTNDFEFYNLSAVDLMCSVIMYNMAVSHRLASKQTSDGKQSLSAKLRGCQKILELALQIIEMQCCAPQQDILKCILCTILSGFIHSTLSVVSFELGETQASCCLQQRCQFLSEELSKVISWECLVFGQFRNKHVAAAA
jgi:hypothetical protein